jgi:glycosyltransferase involved in cell wall biosynthesis
MGAERAKNALPYITIVVPVKNEEKYIEKCLMSLIGQDYPDDKVKVVVVDNGSTDKTAEIVRRYGDSVTLLEKTEGTIGSLRNYGALYHDSEIVAFLDGDSLAPINWLRVGSEMLLADEQISCVGFAMASPMQNSSWVEKIWYQMGNSSRHKGTVEVDWLCSFNLIVKRCFFERVNGFDAQLETGEDFDFGVKLKKISKILFSDRVRVTHLDNSTSAIELFKKELWRGKGGIKNFFKSRNKKKEIASVLVPVVYLLNFICLIWFFFFDRTVFLISFAFFLLIPLCILHKKNILISRNILHGWFFFFIYLIARGIAAFL